MSTHLLLKDENPSISLIKGVDSLVFGYSVFPDKYHLSFYFGRGFWADFSIWPFPFLRFFRLGFTIFTLVTSLK